VNVNNNNYRCCAKMAGKEETPTCRKKTVTWTNEMIEDLIDFIEIHPIVAFEAIYEPILTIIRLGLLTFCCFLFILRWLNSFKNMVLGGPIQSEVNYSLLRPSKKNVLILKPGIHDTSFASKSPFKKT
jgi:hypothetical protein